MRYCFAVELATETFMRMGGLSNTLTNILFSGSADGEHVDEDEDGHPLFVLRTNKL